MSIAQIAYLDRVNVDTPRGSLRVWRERVADVTFTSGAVIVRDALIPDDMTLQRTVAPGTYPFILSLTSLPRDEGEPRPVLAMIEFVPGARAARWEPAHRRQRGEWLHPAITDSMVPIDSWHVGFLDTDAAVAWEQFAKSLPRERKLLAEEHGANKGLWNVHTFHGTQANMVTCFSGLGSGAYPVYWGLDEHGRTVALAVDFGILGGQYAIDLSRGNQPERHAVLNAMRRPPAVADLATAPEK